ncbi:hypothetical protein ColKHC_06097 [Colletotrichum higginsianum]|nr:hypothetical protein ColKHC_06097 [Colletotrichum higginsianum]
MAAIFDVLAVALESSPFAEPRPILTSRGRYVSELELVRSMRGAENAEREDEKDPIRGDENEGDAAEMLVGVMGPSLIALLPSCPGRSAIDLLSGAGAGARRPD